MGAISHLITLWRDYHATLDWTINGRIIRATANEECNKILPRVGGWKMILRGSAEGQLLIIIFSFTSQAKLPKDVYKETEDQK